MNFTVAFLALLFTQKGEFKKRGAYCRDGWRDDGKVYQLNKDCNYILEKESALRRL